MKSHVQSKHVSRLHFRCIHFFSGSYFEAVNNSTIFKIIIKPLIKFFCTETVCKKEDIQLTLKAASAKRTLQNEEKY